MSAVWEIVCMANEITNNRLFGLLSVEGVSALLLSVFLGGIAWQVLASDVDKTKNDVTALQVQQQKLVNDISDVKIDIAKISTRQSSQADDIGELKNDVKFIREFLEKRDRK